MFLCHDSRDKAAVRELARALEDEGILPWLDEERIFPGDAFQAKLEEAIAEARNIALCIGPHGLGRWQEVEYRAAYQRFIEIEELDEESAPARTEVRVIPVLLPGASGNRVPLFAPATAPGRSACVRRRKAPRGDAGVGAGNPGHERGSRGRILRWA